MASKNNVNIKMVIAVIKLNTALKFLRILRYENWYSSTKTALNSSELLS
jgi:hypothetical protein